MNRWICGGCKIRAERLAEVAGGVWVDYMPKDGHLLHISDSLIVEADPSMLMRVGMLGCTLFIIGALVAVGYLLGRWVS